MESGISATEFQFYQPCAESGPGRRGLPVFIRTSAEEGGSMEVVKDKPGHQEGGVGGFPSHIIFDQGTAIFTEVNGVYAYHRYVTPFHPSNGCL
jgi:hypothetical protein